MFSLPKLYSITDTSISGLSHDEQVRQLVAAGVRLIQIREKAASSRDFFEAVKDSLEIARGSGVTILVNDRVDIALATGADGVHLGQDDLSAVDARKILGDGARIGLSTHNLEQAKAAAALPVDYIAIGPVFATTTKLRPAPVVGLQGVADVRKAIGDLPLVAIGGITRENFRSVLDAGADSVAVISGILSDPDGISSSARDFVPANGS